MENLIIPYFQVLYHFSEILKKLCNRQKIDFW